MNRLLIANLMRLKHSKLFWAALAVMAAVPTVAIFSKLIYGTNRAVDDAMFLYPILIGVAVAIFIGIFMGTEYSEGTIRNKLMIGHTRPMIYLANLITAFGAALAMLVAYMLPLLVLGFSIFGTPFMSGATFAKIFFVSLTAILSFCALHMMVSMIYANKAGASVVNLLTAFLMLFIASWLLSKLSEPEFITAYGTGSGTELIRNSAYLEGGLRIFCQMLVDLLPMGQAMQIALGVCDKLWVLPIYSVALTAVCTVVGIAVFNKKNIK